MTTSSRDFELRGWSATEYAVLKGQMKEAKFLANQGVSTYTVPAQMGQSKPTGAAMRTIDSEVLVTLGPSNTRSSSEVLRLSDHASSQPANSDGDIIKLVKISSTRCSVSHLLELPVSNMINHPLHFSLPDDAELMFEIFRCGGEPMGTGTAILKKLRMGFAPNYESLVRDYTIPILANETMAYIGSLTFNVLVCTPFQPPIPPPPPSPGFWKDGSTQIVGHRGFGANTTARTNLQIGENTLQSFLTATNLGASSVEFDVQLTKDHIPVIFHDFVVEEMGGDVPLYTLTLDQFMHLSRSQAPRNDLPSSAEARYLEKNSSTDGPRLRPRSHSVNTYDDYRSQDFNERMRLTSEGMQNNIKGNLRGHSIQEPSCTLEQLLTQLPSTLPFNLEIKHPMLWEAEDRQMPLYAFEINFFLDIILTTIFQHCGKRNITLSSFSPEVCILLAHKQKTFPILFISKAGSVPTGDIRAASLEGAIDFARAWSLAGIVSLSDPFVLCPRLIGHAKEAGLVVGSYGNLNDDPSNALVQAEAGLDAIITNKVRLISETLQKGHI